MISIKKRILPFIITIFTLCLVLFSTSNLNATKNGLNLWVTSVVPSLFPFFVATELLTYTNIPFLLGMLFNIFMKPLFNVKGEGSFAFIMGVISGYPVGAKIVCDFREKKIMSKEECERLLSFTNNSNPLFIIGTIGISMFGNTLIGILLFITHILSSLTVGLIFRFWKKNYIYEEKDNSIINYSKEIHYSELGEILSNSIFNAISSTMMIGGFIVLFSVIISIFKTSKLLNILVFINSPFCKIFKIPSSFIAPLFIGLLELTNGISLISSIHIKAISLNIIFTSFLLGVGGISIFFQILSIVSKTDLSIKPYIIGKLLQGIIASFYTFLFINFIPIFNFNL